MISVTVCVGSSCHVKGAREMINRFISVLSDEDLQDKVELKGAFCMDHCGQGINWKIGDEVITSPSVEEGVRVFRERMFRALKADAVDERGKLSGRGDQA
jgi:NADH-quinone oxidoreductase subunit G